MQLPEVPSVVNLLLQVLCYYVFGNKPQPQTSPPLTALTQHEVDKTNAYCD